VTARGREKGRGLSGERKAETPLARPEGEGAGGGEKGAVMAVEVEYAGGYWFWEGGEVSW